jgi:hypothetical protein
MHQDFLSLKIKTRLVAPNVEALCEGGIFENLSLHFSTTVDYCSTVKK